MSADKVNAVNQLKRNIEAAFAHTKHPGNEQLTHDQCETESDEKRIRDAFKELDWRRLDVPQIRVACCSSSFLTVVGFRYYLPGFLLWILDGRKNHEDLLGTLLYHMTPRADKREFIRRAISERSSGYTPRQREAIAEFFSVLHEFFSQEFFSGELEQREFSMTLRFWTSPE